MMNKKNFMRCYLVLMIGFCIIMQSVSSIKSESAYEEKTKGNITGVLLYVGGLGPGNYTLIQDALDNSSNGDTIFVYDELSPYYENLVINKSVILIGENKNTTVIDGDSNVNGFVIKIYANDVTISGFTIQHYNKSIWPKTAIWINSIRCQISHNVFRNNSVWAMYFYDTSHYNIISDNYIDNCSEGITFQESNNNIIQNNVFINCKIRDIYVVGRNNTISGNRFEQGAGIIIQSLFFTNVYNNSFYNVSIGIDLSHTYFSNIYDNIFLHNGCSIALGINSRLNRIYNNKMNANGYAIKLFHAWDNNISHNTIDDNNFIGIMLEYSHSNIIAQNYIAHQECGLSLLGSSNNIIEKNIMKENNKGQTQGKGGLEILDDSFGNQILNNTFQNNDIDAYFTLRTEFNPPPYYYYTLKKNVWDGNYWNRSRIMPKPIFGHIGTFPLVFPWIVFDWHPAQEPYDIGG